MRCNEINMDTFSLSLSLFPFSPRKINPVSFINKLFVDPTNLDVDHRFPIPIVDRFFQITTACNTCVHVHLPFAVPTDF